MVVRQLVNTLLPEVASNFPRRGLGTGDAFEILYSQLDRIGGTHLMVFDEIDHLDDADTLLYELPNEDCPIARAADRNIPTHMILGDRCYVVSEASVDGTAVQQHEQAVSGCCPCPVFCRYGCLPDYESTSGGQVTVTTYLDDRETV